MTGVHDPSTNKPRDNLSQVSVKRQGLIGFPKGMPSNLVYLAAVSTASSCGMVAFELARHLCGLAAPIVA